MDLREQTGYQMEPPLFLPLIVQSPSASLTEHSTSRKNHHFSLGFTAGPQCAVEAWCWVHPTGLKPGRHTPGLDFPFVQSGAAQVQLGLCVWGPAQHAAVSISHKAIVLPALLAATDKHHIGRGWQEAGDTVAFQSL